MFMGITIYAAQSFFVVKWAVSSLQLCLDGELEEDTSRILETYVWNQNYLPKKMVYDMSLVLTIWGVIQLIFHFVSIYWHLFQILLDFLEDI